MNFRKRTEGVISVFLVIILVPCLFISALFVDTGRIYLSQSMAYSAADLALNTSMTQYDGLLNEYYGLVASCQNMDEFNKKSAEFFVRTISSQNLSDDEIYTLAGQYAAMTNTDDIYDLLKTDAVGDVKIEAVSDANLANSTMLREQVVEFMKYRGPITVVTEVIDRLSCQGDDLNSVKDADENDQAIEEKEEYAEAEAELLSDAYNTYKYLYDNYSTGESGTSPSNELLTGYVNDMNAIKTSYEEINKLMISNLIGTESLSGFSRPTLLHTAYNSTYPYTSSSVYSRKDVDPENEGSYIYVITGEDWTSRLDDLEEANASFKTAISDMKDKMKSVSYTSDTNQIRYWKEVTDELASGNYVSNVRDKADAMVKLYAKCYAMVDCTHENVTTEMEDRWLEVVGEAEALCTKYMTADKVDANDEYLVLVNRLEDISADKADEISSSTLIVPSTGQSVDATLTNNAAKLDVIIAKCDNYITILKHLIDGYSYRDTDGKTIKVLAIKKLKDEAQNYNDQYEEYVDAVENLTPEIYEGSFKQSEEEIIRNSERDTYADINEEQVTILETRLKNIKTQFENVKAAAESMKYGTKKANLIKSYSDMKSAAGNNIKEAEIGLTNASINNYASQKFSSLFSFSNATINTSDTSYNLKLVPPANEGEQGSVDIPKLYRYLHLKFKDANGDKKKEVENQMETAEGEADADNSGEVAEGLFTDGYPDEIADSLLESDDGQRGQSCNLLDAVGSMVSIVEDLTSGDYDNIRDELYIAIYMREMFSYATFEREGLYHLYEESEGGDPKTLTSGNFTNKYSSVFDKWESTDTTDVYNKSLTNKLINETNNPAYRCEWEYILYGKESHEDNVDAAFANIFAIRAALNTVSVFQYFWSGSNPTARTIGLVATSVSALTSGIVPPAAIKVVLLAVLSALETCNDMNRLAAGWPVELYKSEDQWQVSLEVDADSISGAIAELKNIVGYDNGDAEGLFYSDYLTLFMCLGITNDDTSQDIVLRMGDVVQHNMRAITSKDSYALSNATTHFKFKATLEVDPLVVTAPIFSKYNGNISQISWGKYELELIRGY